MDRNLSKKAKAPMQPIDSGQLLVLDKAPAVSGAEKGAQPAVAEFWGTADDPVRRVE